MLSYVPVRICLEVRLPKDAGSEAASEALAALRIFSGAAWGRQPRPSRKEPEKEARAVQGRGAVDKIFSSLLMAFPMSKSECWRAAGQLNSLHQDSRWPDGQHAQSSAKVSPKTCSRL